MSVSLTSTHINIDGLASPPTSNVARGDIYYDTGDGDLKYRDGSNSWEPVAAAGSTAGLAAGAVGQYAAYCLTITQGSTVAGSSIGQAAGTWKALNTGALYTTYRYNDNAYVQLNSFKSALFVRIS